MTQRAPSRVLELITQRGYSEDLLAYDVTPPGMDSAHASLDVVAFTRPAPHDLRTSAIVGDIHPSDSDPGRALALCRAMAAPFLLRGTDGPVDLYQVGRAADSDVRLHTFGSDEANDPLIRSIPGPDELHRAKSGARQLTLFPVDVKLLDDARHKSVGSLKTRLVAAFAHALDGGVPASEAAQLVVNALSCVVVRHKSSVSGGGPASMVAAALQRHGEYFEVLADWESSNQPLVNSILNELGEGVDFSAIDARTLNSIYEQLFLSDDLQQENGIFYTPFEVATRILDTIPIEELAPEDRFVYDPACGSGNLLLAAQERLESLAPAAWAPETTHSWLKTHLAGSDIDPMAVLLAKHSLLVSALPMGNTWKVTRQDFLAEQGNLGIRPNLVVSNPPWQSRKGSRTEKASEFLRGAVDLLAEDGFLACIVPASWLTAPRDRASRAHLNETCELFEVWRLPRDIFSGARVESAVLFARKKRTLEGRRPVFRWVNARAPNREAFIEDGRTSYQAVLNPRVSGDPISAGPLERSLGGVGQSNVLGSIVRSASGQVQRGALVPTDRPGVESIPILGRGSGQQVYRYVDRNCVTWVDSAEQLLGSSAYRKKSSAAPKILVRADHNPAVPWRVRPVLDTIGVAPVGAWHAFFTGDLQTAHALLSLLASSVASVWIHSYAAQKRMTLELFRNFPLPKEFDGHKTDLATLGRTLATLGPSRKLIQEIESKVDSIYGLTAADSQARDQIVSGFKAPEGEIRIHATPSGPDARSEPQDRPRAGSVLAVEDHLLRIWTVDSISEDGQLADLPDLMPGWLAAPGSTFDLRGGIEKGIYTFHRSSHLSATR